MQGSLLLGLSLAAAGCLPAPEGAVADAGPGDTGGGDGDGGSSSTRCKAFADAGAIGPIAGTFVELRGVLASDLDGDGDGDLLLHGATPIGDVLVAARLPQEGELSYHWQAATAGPVVVAAADLVGSDGCAELVIARPGGPLTPFTVLGQQVTGEQIFEDLASRPLAIESTGGLRLAASAGLGDGDPAVAIATPGSLHSLPQDLLLTGEAIPTTVVPDFAEIREIAPTERAERSELLVAENGRLRWMEPVLPGGQMQFNPMRVVSLSLDPVACAGGADLDRDGEQEDVVCVGDGLAGLMLDDSVEPPLLTAAFGASPACGPYEAVAVGRLDGGGDADVVTVDACPADQVAVQVLVNARVAAGPALDGSPLVAREVTDLVAVALALVDRDGDGRDEVWLFDATGASRCDELDGGELVPCGG